ncbi:glycoside hydrolase family 95 protein [Luteolibacter sp. LG18]|uniref:glycoside hydrolase family 95 protein n=1 Tax=Luteolibacter sp. LG18 TaxID=2819286 RepID=UPI002B2F5406|nr:alpha/beta hydrolase [Luteolibacter sp. LG18]
MHPSSTSRRAALLLLASVASCLAAGGPNEVLWYNAPAARWIEALPVGNGRLGAMIHGQPGKERLQLNDVTVWSGDPQPDADRKDAWKDLAEVRKTIRDGKYDLAEKLCNAKLSGPAPYENSYQTLGDLNFDFTLPADPKAVSGYRRQLDVADAVAAVSFQSGDTRFTREIFSSAADGVLVQRLQADKKGALTFKLNLSRVERAKTRFEAPDTLVMTGDTGNTLGYEVRVRVLAKGGKVAAEGEALTVSGADDATVLLTAATTFVLDYDKGYKGGDLGVAAARLKAASAKSYDTLKSAHLAEYHKYYDRVKLDTGSGNATVPTDERLKAYGEGKSDPGFAALFYQYGRYLLISSSRPDNPLPSNSQGIWGDGLKLPWRCDYKSNINYQMNYWAAEASNLGEMHLPMLRMTANLVKPGTKTAQAYFGPTTPGWVVGYTTNGWSWTSPGARLSWGVWWGGSAWMCQHLWDHYAYTRDAAYLKGAYPVLKGAAEFWMANLVEGTDGKLITSPSSSPENNFITDTGIKSSVCEGATMEKSIVWDLLSNTAQAAAVMGNDEAFRKKVEAARDRIRPPQIGKGGQLMEWGGDWDLNSQDPHHRHVSHLFALHPGHEIGVLSTPALAAAARKTLELRGDDGTGWSKAWKINFWARLREGDHAHKLLSDQLTYTTELRTVMSGGGGTYPNLFDAHPPFQIDGNFGAVSGINEMLLQTQERYTDSKAPSQDRYVIDLLPALPSTWQEGSVTGLRARGGFEVALKWKAGKLETATIRSTGGTAAKVRANGKLTDLTLKPGETKTLKE